MTLDVNVAPDITLTFAVPVMAQTMPNSAAVNAGLVRAILGRERASPGRSKSNAGGWHSEETLWDWPEPEIAALKGWVDTAVQRMCRLPMHNKPATGLQLAYRATGWANTTRSMSTPAATGRSSTTWRSARRSRAIPSTASSN
jgi:hypothetical protein